MHVLEGMQILNSSTDISKVTLDLIFGEVTKTELDFFVKGASLRELEHHIGHILLLFIIIVE